MLHHDDSLSCNLDRPSRQNSGGFVTYFVFQRSTEQKKFFSNIKRLEQHHLCDFLKNSNIKHIHNEIIDVIVEMTKLFYKPFRMDLQWVLLAFSDLQQVDDVRHVEEVMFAFCRVDRFVVCCNQRCTLTNIVLKMHHRHHNWYQCCYQAR